MMKKTKKTQEVDTRFHDFCNKISLTDFLNIEKTRIKYFKLFALLFAISVFTWKCIYFLLKRNDGLDNNEVVALILLFFVGIFVLLYPCDKFHSFTKTRFSDFFSSLFGDFRYCKEVSLIAELKKYAPFNFFYRYRIIDALIGSYNDVNIEVADVILQASSRRNVGFSGFVLFLDFKNISSPGIICSSKRRHFIFCVIYSLFVAFGVSLLFKSTSPLYLFHAIALIFLYFMIIRITTKENKGIKNNETLLKEFNLLKIDDINNINPSLLSVIEKINDLATTFNGKIDGFSFENNKILVLIRRNGSHLFENPSLFKKVEKNVISYKQFLKIQSIFDLIDCVKEKYK